MKTDRWDTTTIEVTADRSDYFEDSEQAEDCTVQMTADVFELLTALAEYYGWRDSDSPCSADYLAVLEQVNNTCIATGTTDVEVGACLLTDNGTVAHIRVSQAISAVGLYIGAVSKLNITEGLYLDGSPSFNVTPIWSVWRRKRAKPFVNLYWNAVNSYISKENIADFREKTIVALRDMNATEEDIARLHEATIRNAIRGGANPEDIAWALLA